MNAFDDTTEEQRASRGSESGHQLDMAEAMHRAIESQREEPFYRPLRIRLKDMGDNVRDEQAQFRQLLKAIRKSPSLLNALEDAGFVGIANVNPLRPGTHGGRWIQAFNHLIEAHWEE